MNVCLVGYGNAGRRLHRNAYPKSVKIVGVVDQNEEKRAQAREDGFCTFISIQDALESLWGRVDFWDICTSHSSHISAVAELLMAKEMNILLEKPICGMGQLDEMRELVGRFPDAAICVQEQLLSSQVVAFARDKIKEYGLIKPEIFIESSKNRISDIKDGRYIDEELKIFGYDAVHLLATLTGLGHGPDIDRINRARVYDMAIQPDNMLTDHGAGEIHLKTVTDCDAHLYTAMDGCIFYQ